MGVSHISPFTGHKKSSREAAVLPVHVVRGFTSRKEDVFLSAGKSLIGRGRKGVWGKGGDEVKNALCLAYQAF
jgi:hypothetical protein